ncbi:MAG: hypothetical protein HYU35_01715 [Parcubacteria group bacterium]|nr:hypothetical protein [Parcubacteria group bacterium]
MRYTVIIMRDIVVVKKYKRPRPERKKKPEAQEHAAPVTAPVEIVLAGTALHAAAPSTAYQTPPQSQEENPRTTNTPVLPNVLSWETLEYVHRPKSADWYWMVGFLSVLVVVAAILLHNFLLGVLALVSGFTVILLGAQHPQKFLFRLSERGVTIHKKLYPYDTLDSFWVYYEPGGKKALSIKSKKKMVPQLVIPLDTMNPVVVRDYMLQFLKEVPQEESIIDEISERVGW